MILQPLHHIQFFRNRLVIHSLFRCLCNSSFQNLDVRENKFHINCINIANRIYRTFHMNHICILKATNYMHNGIHLTNIGKKLITQSLPLGGSLYKSGNINKFNRRMRHFFGVIHFSEFFNSLIRHRHNSHIRINGTKRKISRLCPRLCQ